MNTVKLKEIISEDFVNYYLPTMSLLFPFCTMKCNIEYGEEICQNTNINNNCFKTYSIDDIFKAFIKNDISQAICCYGMEPIDSFNELLSIIKYFRDNGCMAAFIIYSGYYKSEIKEQINQLKQYPNIIIKFGRFKPNQQSHFDELLGVNLANDEQYAERIS